MAWWSAVARVSAICSSWPASTGRRWPSYPCSYPARVWLNRRGLLAPKILWIAAVRVPRRCWRRCRRNLPPTSYAKDGYVSEATPPKEQQPPVAEAPPAAVSAPVTKPASRGNRLVVLALLLGAAGVAAAGWGLWQLRSLELRDQQQLRQLEAARSQTEALAQRTQGLDARLQQLPGADELDARRRLVAQLQGDQQLLNQRLETVLGASRQDWRLAEAEHLLRL